MGTWNAYLQRVNFSSTDSVERHVIIFSLEPTYYSPYAMVETVENCLALFHLDNELFAFHLALRAVMLNGTSSVWVAVEQNQWLNGI